ncbi:MAG: translation elongation factor Ts [Verrucomicrobia bacterium]|nr:translation elongation factor Ts [Verrucomicrobiota bacterium]MCH8511367.1 translation elongation factor Ts [Kiritimatiellia bacterium]
MTQITATQVKELRTITNVGMMECKKALQETAGDIEAAIKLLRERGLAVAAKKADRAANEGLIDIAITDNAQTGAMVEVNCETDFVAKNENFQAFVAELAQKALSLGDNELATAEKENLAFKVSEIGENLVINRNVTYKVQGAGAIGKYIHLGGKVGVMVEIGCENAANSGSADLVDLGKEVALHIAAASPAALDRGGLDPELIESEKALYAKQVEGKPANIIEKILEGKMAKFYSQVVLTEQGFVKDPDITVQNLVDQVGKKLGDTLTIRRYARYQIGN